MAADAVGSGAKGAGVHGTVVVALFGGGLAGDSPFDLFNPARILFDQEPNLAVGFASIVFWHVREVGRFLIGGQVGKMEALALSLCRIHASSFCCRCSMSRPPLSASDGQDGV